MAGVERLELPTIGFGDRCSTNWNYTPATDSNYTDAQPKVKSNLLNNLNSLAVWLLNEQISKQINKKSQIGIKSLRTSKVIYLLFSYCKT